MSKRMHLNGFAQCATSSQSPGQWKDPADKTAEGYADLDFWVNLAQICERGFFDSMFFADSHGAKDIYGGNADAAISNGLQFPGNDPTLLPPVLARETEHIGFILTYSTTYYQPFHIAKLFSSLDHFTKGRVGWNIVTSYLETAYRNGLGEKIPHDERYEKADELMEVTYRLWEESWDSDAIVRDVEADVHTDPRRVHKIHHEGKYYSVEGPHMCAPSAQRTPFLVQAGGSPRGNAFAGAHAEAVFTLGTTVESVASNTRKLREAAVAEGRDANSIKVLAGISWVVAETEEEAQAKYDRYLANGSVEGALALYGGWTGVDLSGYRPEDTLDAFESQGMQAIAKMFGSIEGGRAWTFGEMSKYMTVSSVMPVIIGTPEMVADELERWMDEGDIDGFNLTPIQNPGDFEDFVNLVVPVLQSRGRLRTSYEGSTLRESFLGEGQQQLADDHPARKLIRHQEVMA